MKTPRRSRPYPRKTERINVRVPAVLRKKIDDLAAAVSLTPPEVVRRLIERATLEDVSLVHQRSIASEEGQP